MYRAGFALVLQSCAEKIRGRPVNTSRALSRLSQGIRRQPKNPKNQPLAFLGKPIAEESAKYIRKERNKEV